MRSEQPAVCISSLNEGHTVIINFSGVTCGSQRYLFPTQTCWTYHTGLSQYFKHWTWHQKNYFHLRDLSTYIIKIWQLKHQSCVYLYEFHGFFLFLQFFLCPELGVNCPGESSCEATRVAGELSWAFSKHMSLPHGFVLLPKDVPELRLNKAQTTMKQQGFCSWCCCSLCQDKHCIGKKIKSNTRNWHQIKI